MSSPIFLTVLVALIPCLVFCEDYPDPCAHEVYCKPGKGGLLHTVQMAKLFNDSKTFVDMPMTMPKAKVLANFRKLMKETQESPTREQVERFVGENFSQEGTEFEDWTPTDWKDNPDFLKKINDPEYRKLAEFVHRVWKDLGRKIRRSLRDSQQTSLIYLEKPFVVPGGRFREMYYWDSHWTIMGLLESEMTDTAKGMLENFAFLVDTLGLIPNGNRIYYTRRSQPPLFISMVHEYYKVTQDDDLVSSILDAMEKEFQFWMHNRTTKVNKDGKEYTLAIYNVEVDGPRPESYREDYNDAQSFSSKEEMVNFYMDIKSGAESGWDFSTKWFVSPDGEISTKLTDIKTRTIVPVELNSYLCRSSRILAGFFEGRDEEKAETYRNIEKQFKDAIEAVMWNNEQGAWFDYDLVNEQPRLFFFPSNVAPLWAECYTETKTRDRIKAVVNYLKKSEALKYPGGVPTSMLKSGQQWDFSNAWPPLQEIIITGLENSGDEEASALALRLTKKWVKNIWVSYDESGQSMFEKYDVTRVGPGGDGEYKVQEGFGWTNGVLLNLLSRYGDRVSSDDVISGSIDLRCSAALLVSSVVIVLAGRVTLADFA